VAKKTTIILCILLAVAVVSVSGCFKTKTKYVCPSGGVVDDPEWCPQKLLKATTTVSNVTTTTSTTSSTTTSLPPEALCDNRVRDSSEIGIDCGGVCNRPCVYTPKSCQRGLKKEYNVSGEIYLDKIDGLRLREGKEYCVVIQSVFDANDNKIKQRKLFFDETIGASADIIEEYDVYGSIVGVAGAYISTSHLNFNGEVLFSESCIDGEENQDEVDVDCGGVCPKCAVKNVSISISRPEVRWYSASRRGQIKDVDFELTNTGDVEIEPRFDVYIYRDIDIFREDYIDATSSVEDPVAPGQTIRGFIRINYYTYTRDEYKVVVSVRDGSWAQVLGSASRFVTFPES